MKKGFLLFIISFIIALPTIAQTGKIVGKITDEETGEPLIGANVIIEGTNLGAATNLDGDYLIINVPPRTYTIVAKYIGYQDVAKSNITISINVTTEVNFALKSTEYQLSEITIVATKPLINKNVTNSVSIIGAEDIENIPVRGVANIVSSETGVVEQDGNLHVRGGRQDAVAYYVDGVLVNDPVFGGAQNLGIQNAVQEIQFQAGGYSAEFGGANSGIISIATKTGSENYKFGIETITDNFTGKVGEKFLGTYLFGYSEYVVTASGPVIPSYKDLRFYIGGSNTFNRSPIGFYKGIDIKGVYDPSAPIDTFDVYYPDGYQLNRPSNTYQLQGNLTWDANPFSFKLSGSYNQFERRDNQIEATHGDGIRRYRTAERAGLNEGQTITASLKTTHVLSDYAFYDLIVSFFDDYNVDMDPIFKHDITLYGDSIANAQVGTTLRGFGQYPLNLTAFNINFIRQVIPYNNYAKNRSRYLGGVVNLFYQLGNHHELKTGGDYKYYTIRRYALAPFSIATLSRSIPDGDFTEMYNRLDNYGYDVFGNTYNGDGLDASRHPVFAAYYIQDKMEFSDLVINAGLRLDYIDTDSKEFINPHNIQFLQGNIIDPATLKDVDPFVYISPRIGFSFPVTDKTVFHAQYGKFIQQSRLRDVYQGYNVISDNIKGGFAIQNPVGFGLKPERATQYEIGFKQQIGESFAFNITGFYKDIKDQIQIRSIYADADAGHKQYYAFVNGDFETVKGIELSFDLRRTERFAVSFNYTFSDALGTGSNPSSSFRQIWQSPTNTPYFPEQIAPVDFNQAHRGNLFIDYRFANDDGPSIFGAKLLENTGLDLFFSFNSGFNYTRWDDFSFGNRRFPTESLNASTTPWTFNLDAKADKSFNIGDLSFNIYLWVINVLNTQNVLNVFNVSGDAYDDGWLSSPEGSANLENIRKNYGEEQAQRYTDLYRASIYDSGNFGVPRQFRLGVKLNY